MKMGTYTGRQIDLRNMSKDDIDLTDITISLSRQNRYMGHILIDWSVLKHSILASMVADILGYSDDVKKLMILHDVHETWFQDRTAPIISQFPDPEWDKARDACDVIVHDFFGLTEQFNDENMKKTVKTLDRATAVIEMMCTMSTFNWTKEKERFAAPVVKAVEALIEQNVKIPIDLIDMEWSKVCSDFYEILAVIHFEGNTGAEIVVDDAPTPKDTDGNT